MMREKYRLFLENLLLINKKYEILNTNNNNFNIFTILRKAHDEQNLHSKFITKLLENKLYGKILCELFLEELSIDVEIKNYSITTEYYLENGRIDIFLVIIGEKQRKAIVIENKIYATDQEKQLVRYFQEINKTYKAEEIEIVYLTLDGKEPSENSCGNLENIKIMSYKEDIFNWIENCIKEVAENPKMRETLIQYKDLIKELTNKGDEKMNNELKEIILKKPDYLKTAYLIPDVLTNIKKDLQFKFWEKLEGKLNGKLEKQVIKLFKYPNCHYSKNLIERYYTNSNKNKFYGLMYYIKDIENRGALYLRIEIESNLYWGFRIIDVNGNSNNNSNNNLKDDYLKDILDRKGFVRTDWWLGWKYLYLEGETTINFRSLDSKLAAVLNDNENLEKLVEKLSKDIKKDLDSIKDLI